MITGATGTIGHVACKLLVERGSKVRALVRSEDARSAKLANLGVEIVVGDLLDLHAMHRAIEGCERVYFGMAVSPSYLEATVNAAAVAKHHKVSAFVNISQMTVSQMSINSTTDSPQQKLHWLAEQALNWSDYPSYMSAPRHSWTPFSFDFPRVPSVTIDKFVYPSETGRRRR